MEVDRGFLMHGHPVGARIEEQGDEVPRPLDHQVDVQGEPGGFPERSDSLRPEGQVGHEVPVHDVDMDQVGAGLLGHLHRLAHLGEIGGQDRRRQHDHRLTSREMRLLLETQYPARGN